MHTFNHDYVTFSYNKLFYRRFDLEITNIIKCCWNIFGAALRWFHIPTQTFLVLHFLVQFSPTFLCWAFQGLCLQLVVVMVQISCRRSCSQSSVIYTCLVSRVLAYPKPKHTVNFQCGKCDILSSCSIRVYPQIFSLHPSHTHRTPFYNAAIFFPSFSQFWIFSTCLQLWVVGIEQWEQCYQEAILVQ